MVALVRKTPGVRRRRYAAPGPTDRRLDPYRRGIASVWDDDVLVGYLATRVRTWWTEEGRWWRRRYVNPVERPEFLLSLLGSGDPSRYVDGVAGDVGSVINEWDCGRFRFGGRTLAQRWLAGAEADAAWDDYGWD